MHQLRKNEMSQHRMSGKLKAFMTKKGAGRLYSDGVGGSNNKVYAFNMKGTMDEAQEGLEALLEYVGDQNYAVRTYRISIRTQAEGLQLWKTSTVYFRNGKELKKAGPGENRWRVSVSYTKPAN